MSNIYRVALVGRSTSYKDVLIQGALGIISSTRRMIPQSCFSCFLSLSNGKTIEVVNIPQDKNGHYIVSNDKKFDGAIIVDYALSERATIEEEVSKFIIHKCIVNVVIGYTQSVGDNEFTIGVLELDVKSKALTPFERLFYFIEETKYCHKEKMMLSSETTKKYTIAVVGRPFCYKTELIDVALGNDYNKSILCPEIITPKYHYIYFENTVPHKVLTVINVPGIRDGNTYKLDSSIDGVVMFAGNEVEIDYLEHALGIDSTFNHIYVDYTSSMKESSIDRVSLDWNNLNKADALSVFQSLIDI